MAGSSGTVCAPVGAVSRAGPTLNAAPTPDLADPAASARAAGLRYVSDARPGIRREKRANRFRYLHPDGTVVRDEDTLGRIKALAIPPAWTDVWICPIARGHLQATGRDQKGRKQARYHARWRDVRDALKYDRMLEFAAALPSIRARVERDLSLPGMPRDKVLATVVKLLEETRIRVGNETYRRQNRSFGLTTLRNRHVDVQGSTVRFHFRGKSGKEHEVTLRDRRLARILHRAQEIPGQELFQYLDEDGTRQTIDSGDVNEYLREISGGEFTAKDFRTWAGTVLAASFLRQAEPFSTEKQGRGEVVRAIEQVADRLGNTVAVCRKAYVHPAVIEAYVSGSLLSVPVSAAPLAAPGTGSQLSPDEALTVDLLRTLAAAKLHEARQQAA